MLFLRGPKASFLSVFILSAQSILAASTTVSGSTHVISSTLATSPESSSIISSSSSSTERSGNKSSSTVSVKSSSSAATVSPSSSARTTVSSRTGSASSSVGPSASVSASGSASISSSGRYTSRIASGTISAGVGVSQGVSRSATSGAQSQQSTLSATPTSIITLVPGGPAASATVVAVAGQVNGASDSVQAVVANPSNQDAAKKAQSDLQGAKKAAEAAAAVAISGLFASALASLATAIGTAESAAATIVAGGTDIAALTAAMTAVTSALDKVKKEEDDAESSTKKDQSTKPRSTTSKPTSSTMRSSSSSSSSSSATDPPGVPGTYQIPQDFNDWEEPAGSLVPIPEPWKYGPNTITVGAVVYIYGGAPISSSTASRTSSASTSGRSSSSSVASSSSRRTSSVSSSGRTSLSSASSTPSTLHTSTRRSTTRASSSSPTASGTLLPCPPKDFTNKTDFTWTMPANSNTFNLKYTKDKNPELFTPGTSWYFTTNAKLDEWDADFPGLEQTVNRGSASAVIEIPRDKTFDSLIVIGVLNGYTNCGPFDLKFSVIGSPSASCSGNNNNHPTLSQAPTPTCTSSTSPVPSSTSSVPPPPPPPTATSDFHITGIFGRSAQTQDWVIGVPSSHDDCTTIVDNIGLYALHAHAVDEQDVPPGDIIGKSNWWIDTICATNTRVDFTKTSDSSWTFKSALFTGSCWSNADTPQASCTGTGFRANSHYDFQQYLVCTANIAGLCNLDP